MESNNKANVDSTKTISENPVEEKHEHHDHDGHNHDDIKARLSDSLNSRGRYFGSKVKN